jgi:hydroxymethylglutaryl-CoA synthase
MAGLLAYGAYVPRSRLQRSAIFKANAWFAPGLRGIAKGERAMAGWDEDVVTMAVEAARDCLRGIERDDVTGVSLASTTAPFADRQNAGLIKEALTLQDATASIDVGGSQRAGTSALLQALQSVESSNRRLLCLAADKPRGMVASELEMQAGDAAVGFLVGEGDTIADLIGTRSVTIDFVDHYRTSDREFDYSWESRWIRDEGYLKIISGAIKDALAELDVTPERIAHLVVPIVTRGVGAAIAKKVGIAADAVVDPLYETLGQTGVAHAGIMLASALERAKAGDLILVAGFGQGCDVLVFEVTDRIGTLAARRGVSGALARRAAEDNYMKFLTFNDMLPIEKGARAEADLKQAMSALYRSRRTVLGLVGGRCTVTGTIQFPKSEISVNPNNHTIGTQEDYFFAERKCRIMTHTTDRLTYTMNPPAYYGMVEFEGGGRMMAEFVDVEEEDVAVGREMEMVFRVKDIDQRRGFKRYFWKATPVV